MNKSSGETAMPDPAMPKQMTFAATDAIERIASYRSWTTVEMYLEIREALQQPHAWPEPPKTQFGAPPGQGRNAE